MASPRLGFATDLFVAAAGTRSSASERTSKLAMADHGADPRSSRTPTTNQSARLPGELPLTDLYVPNTLLSGLNAGRDLSVRAADLRWATIRLNSDGVSEDDYYSFEGRANEVHRDRGSSRPCSHDFPSGFDSDFDSH